MANKISRNDACFCNSKKKYKKCCITINENIDIFWNKIAHLEARLFSYANQAMPRSIIQDAIDDFCPRETVPDEIDEDLMLNQLIVPWLLFNWIPETNVSIPNFNTKQSIAINYLNSYENTLNPEEKQFLTALDETYYSFYHTLHVEPERYITVRDILLNTTHTIKERRGTRSAQEGSIFFGRIVFINQQSLFFGIAPFLIPSKYHLDLVNFRHQLIEENDGNPLTAYSLQNIFDIDVFDCFFDIMETAFRPPIITNTDGDLIVFTTSHFTLNTSIEDAIECLTPLTLSKSKNPEDFLEYIERDNNGEVQEVQFQWVIEGNKQHKNWENTVLGIITIQKNKLILETNSVKRNKKGKQLLAKYLDKKIHFLQTSLESLEQKMKSMPAKKTIEQKSSEFETPESQEFLKKMAKKHWENWLDESIPALNYLTPREAAKTKIGREQLEAILLHLEYDDYEANSKKHFFKTNIDYLKSQLNLK